MSYCRWSSDNWKCDLYCYESSQRFITHVAGNRIVGDVPLLPDILTADQGEWSRAHEKQMDFLNSAEHIKIGLPYDGETFIDKTLEDFKKRIIQLKEAGYCVPDYVIESIEEEIEARDS